MTGPLALVGGGEFTDGCTFDAELLASVGATEVALLATGWAYENPGKAVAAARAWFGAMDVSVVEVPVYTRADAMSAENAALVRAARMIYLTGVSPMHMRSVLLDTPVLDAVLSTWEAGAALVGADAGADVLCDPMVDIRGGAFTVGLGLLKDVAVMTHCDERSHDMVKRTIELTPEGVLFVELPTCTAVIDDNGEGRWRVAGSGPVQVHRAGTVVSVDELPAARR